MLSTISSFGSFFLCYWSFFLFQKLLAGLPMCNKRWSLKWNNWLRPDFKRGILSQEKKIIIELHFLLFFFAFSHSLIGKFLSFFSLLLSLNLWLGIFSFCFLLILWSRTFFSSFLFFSFFVFFWGKCLWWVGILAQDL